MNEPTTIEQRISDRIFTINAHPIRYFVIPKCGCTFIKNILFQLEHGESYHEPRRIHREDAKFMRASALGLTPREIAKEDYAFCVIRNPMDRFLSLYIDKVIGPGRKPFVRLAKLLRTKYGLIDIPFTQDDHEVNLTILIDWLEKNIKSNIDMPSDPHWTPIAYRRNVLEQCDLKILTVDGLSEQLTCLLGGLVPNLAQLMQSSERNSTQSAEMKEMLNFPNIRARVEALYHRDLIWYQRCKSAWDRVDPNDPMPDIPRFSDLARSNN